VRQELALLIPLGRVLIYLNGFKGQGVCETYNRAMELCQQTGTTDELLAVLHGLYTCQSSYADCLPIALQRLQLAEAKQNVIYLVSAHHILGNNLMFLGDLVPAQAHFEQCAALYNQRDHHEYVLLFGQDEGVAGLANQALTEWQLGYPDRALALGEATVNLALSLAHPMTTAIALNFLALIHLNRGDFGAAHRPIDRLTEIANEHGFTQIAKMATLYRCQELLHRGEWEPGLAPLLHRIEMGESEESGFIDSYPLLVLARAFLQQGEYARGLAWLDRAQRGIDVHTARLSQAEAYRLKGELLWALAQSSDEQSEDRLVEAEAALLEAVETARRQHAKSYELRGMISLCRLWQRQGRVMEAHAALSGVYSWFTEGFDTADLVEARRLLDELASELSQAGSAWEPAT
jgi:predicted ATPase